MKHLQPAEIQLKRTALPLVKLLVNDLPTWVTDLAHTSSYTRFQTAFRCSSKTPRETLWGSDVSRKNSWKDSTRSFLVYFFTLAHTQTAGCPQSPWTETSDISGCSCRLELILVAVCAALQFFVALLSIVLDLTLSTFGNDLQSRRKRNTFIHRSVPTCILHNIVFNMKLSSIATLTSAIAVVLAPAAYGMLR